MVLSLQFYQTVNKSIFLVLFYNFSRKTGGKEVANGRPDSLEIQQLYNISSQGVPKAARDLCERHKANSFSEVFLHLWPKDVIFYILAGWRLSS